MSIEMNEQIEYLKIKYRSDKNWYANIMAHALMNWLQEGKISQRKFEQFQEQLFPYLSKTLL